LAWILAAFGDILTGAVCASVITGNDNRSKSFFIEE
jgi:hypothetical protein